MTPRQPAGVCSLGALSGTYPNPSSGFAKLGISIADDFIGAISKSNPRTSEAWTFTDVHGTNTVTSITDTASEVGILRLQTAGAALDGISGYLTDGLIVPTAGLSFLAKIRGVSGSTHVRAWAGLADGGTSDWAIASATKAIGVRAIATGAGDYLYGVCKNGAGAGNETTQNLGVIFNETDWRRVGFTITADGVQFWLADMSRMDSRGLAVDNVGDPITTNVPSVGLIPTFGVVVGASAVVRGLDLDLFEISGAIPR